MVRISASVRQAVSVLRSVRLGSAPAGACRAARPWAWCLPAFLVGALAAGMGMPLAVPMRAISAMADEGARPGGPCATIQGDQIVLHLRAGGCGPLTVFGGSAPDIPPGEVRVVLPRYPGAAPTGQPMAAIMSLPLDPYLKEASAAFLVPRADPSAVAAWYAGRLSGLGYAQDGGGTGVDSSRPITETATTTGFAMPGATERGVQVQVEATSAGATLLLIEAHVVVPPPRPRGSLVPSDPASLSVAFGSREDAAATRQWAAMARIPYRPWQRTVRDRPTLTRFAGIVNALPVLTGVSGATLDPREASLSFRTGAGPALVFTLDACCAGVRGPDVTLADPHGALWAAMLSLAPSP